MNHNKQSSANCYYKYFSSQCHMKCTNKNYQYVFIHTCQKSYISVMYKCHKALSLRSSRLNNYDPGIHKSLPPLDF